MNILLKETHPTLTCIKASKSLFHQLSITISMLLPFRVAASERDAVSVITLLEDKPTSDVKACNMSNILSCTRVSIDVESLLNSETIVLPDGTVMARDRDMDMGKYNATHDVQDF